MPDETPTGPNGEDRRKATDRSELLQAATELKEATASLGEKFETTQTFSRETRRIAKVCADTSDKLSRWVKVLIAVVIVLALVTGGVIANAVRSNEANSKANRIQEYQVASCDSANDSRAAQRQLWAYVLDLSSKTDPSEPKMTAAEKKRLAQFRVYVNTTFAAKDCSVVEEGKVK